MDATCAIQASIHVFSLVRKYVSRILGTYQYMYIYLKNPNRLRPHYIWEINKNKENKPKPHIQNILKMENTF